MSDESSEHIDPVGHRKSEVHGRQVPRIISIITIIALGAGIFWGFVASKRNSERSVNDPKSYEKAVASLAEGKDDATIESALDTFEKAGIKAFPVLIAHLNDKALASERHFQREAVDIDAGGHTKLHHPTIGDACFDILQGEVEGNWPKGFRQYNVLERVRLAEWWKKHESKSLHDIRLECVQISLSAARNDLKKQNAPTAAAAVKFLEDRLRQIQTENK